MVGNIIQGYGEIQRILTFVCDEDDDDSSFIQIILHENIAGNTSLNLI